MTIGERIRCFRKRAGLTQAELGQMVSLSCMTIRRYECGERGVRMDSIEKIASALNVSVSEIVDGTIVSDVPQKPKLKIHIDLSCFDMDSMTALKLEDNAFTVSGIMEDGCQVSYHMGAAAAKEKGIVSFENE